MYSYTCIYYLFSCDYLFYRHLQYSLFLHGFIITKSCDVIVQKLLISLEDSEKHRYIIRIINIWNDFVSCFLGGQWFVEIKFNQTNVFDRQLHDRCVDALRKRRIFISVLCEDLRCIILTLLELVEVFRWLCYDF